jgi:outer membrane lipoprotein-sorting protein
MRKLAIITVISILALTGMPGVSPATADTEVDAIIDKVDKLFRSDNSYSELEMEITTPNWQRTLKMNMWTEGMDKTFIRVTHPRKDAGMATLRIETEMWNYFPKINKVMKVPPSMMMSSWMGSDFTNDDLVKESSLREDYDGRLFVPEGGDPGVYYIELVPHTDSPIVWGKLIFTVRKDDYMPLKEEFYDEKGQLMRIMEFTDVRDFGGRRIPAVLEMVNLAKEDHKTIIRYNEAKFDIKMRGDTFTLRNLQKRK